MNEIYSYYCTEYNEYKKDCNRRYTNNTGCVFGTKSDILGLPYSFSIESCEKGIISIDWVNNVKCQDIIKIYCISHLEKKYRI